jgi:hypothetical protein
MIGLAEGPRRIGVPMMIGLLTVPLVFGWLLLRPGYSKTTRGVVAVYALLGPALAILASVGSPGG